MTEERTRILLCEDDENLGGMLSDYLQAKGYETDLRQDGQEGLKAFSSKEYDICLLDVMMPVVDGFTLAGQIRQKNPDIPIIFLTAKTLRSDILEGFRIGADDYITKPFSMEELNYRIMAVLRRSSGRKNDKSSQGLYQVGMFTFNVQKQTLKRPDKEEVKLTTKECDLLELLCQNANDILERNYALRQIWEDDNYFNARSMDVYITKLRKHLKDDPKVEIINIHGKGYKIVIPSDDDDA